MGIPACLAGHVFALHGLVTGNHILDHPGQHMTDMRLPIGCGRPVIKGVGFPIPAVLHTLAEDIIILPKLLCGLFPLHKVHIRFDLVIHKILLYIISCPLTLRRKSLVL